MVKRFSVSMVVALLVLPVIGWSQDARFVQSDAIGVEDIWENPSFAGGSANNGATAHSEI